ncbi:hypothetical protein [Agrobacterium tumefaciens]|uniref:hypothetical protein n=1 Tax=Agrobacterium tumefaciens TaxID=358 RepID=UPI001F1F9255
MANVLGANAEDAYKFDLKLTSPNAIHDPDGVWDDSDLEAVRSAGLKPQIYTARISTPAGQWLLSQLAGMCNMQGMCGTLLVKIVPGKSPLIYANPQVSEGGSAELSLNYKKITTIEIDQNGKAFKGSYDVGPFR